MTTTEINTHAINPNCTECGECPPVCPTGSIFPGNGQYIIDIDTCRGCENCVLVCPEDAIHPKN